MSSVGLWYAGKEYMAIYSYCSVTVNKSGCIGCQAAIQEGCWPSRQALVATDSFTDGCCVIFWIQENWIADISHTRCPVCFLFCHCTWFPVSDFLPSFPSHPSSLAPFCHFPFDVSAFLCSTGKYTVTIITTINIIREIFLWSFSNKVITGNFKFVLKERSINLTISININLVLHRATWKEITECI